MREGKNTFKALILSVLEKFPSGISEYNLLQELKGKTERIPENFGHNNLSLFQSHFHLFNALYELQEELPKIKEKTIEITPLLIQARALSSTSTNKSLIDNTNTGLRNYYLDMTNMEKTTSDDVENMLDRFWQVYFSHNKKPEALSILGLDEQASFNDIRKRYRELAKELHPDRGGDKEKLQELNEAMEILKIFYKK